jgi:prepilin-type N-terminal cleavage/methylation domain-containing protein
MNYTKRFKMRKLGFTLAEVLITLAIVGVIAALTIPGLTANVSKKSIGPALAKAVNNLNSVNAEALEHSGKTRLDDIVGNGYYSAVLEAYMGGVLYPSTTEYYKFLSNDGIMYIVHSKVSSLEDEIDDERYCGVYWPVTIDINGKKGKNETAKGTEQFLVYVDAFGKVILAGSQEAVDYGIETTKLDCKKDKTINEYCTATVAKYGWEVTY